MCFYGCAHDNTNSKKAIFNGLSTKEDIVDDLTVNDEDNIEEEVPEVTVMEIDNFAKRVYEGNGRRHKKETPSKP